MKEQGTIEEVSATKKEHNGGFKQQQECMRLVTNKHYRILNIRNRALYLQLLKPLLIFYSSLEDDRKYILLG